MKSFLFVLLCAASLTAVAANPAGQMPNVLFIAIDDQNDWIGALGGHPLVKTPNIDRLARRGTVLLNAHCQAPLCNPSRASLMTGLRPTTTGIYGLAPSFRSLPQWQNTVTLPQHFQAHGYRTYGVGKIYHEGFLAPTQMAEEPKRKALLAAEFDVVGPLAGVGAMPPKKLLPPTPMGNHELMDWGTFPHEDRDKQDYRIADWAIDQLKTMPKNQPFFLATGFFLPHVPCFATQRWFDLYPDDDSVLPPFKADDRADTPRFSWYLHWRLPEPRLAWLQANNQWRNLVRSYLACVSFADAQVGRVLDALEASGQAENTIVVLWSDHGWHLGEKGITGKNTIWERSTRVPLIFAGPGITARGRSTQPVELLDIYPTLAALCGLPKPRRVEGISLVPQLRDAGAVRRRPAITSHNQGNHAVRSERYRYIRYADGSEELYDHQTDPNEWRNLVGEAPYAAVIAEHKRWLPKVDVPPAPGSASRILTYDAGAGNFEWEGKTYPKDSPIPE